MEQAMILTSVTLGCAALCYWIGTQTPGRFRHGTAKGWIAALVIGALLAAVYYGFSAFGLLVSIDNLVDGL
jgi:hypothetical protein